MVLNKDVFSAKPLYREVFFILQIDCGYSDDSISISIFNRENPYLSISG